MKTGVSIVVNTRHKLKSVAIATFLEPAVSNMNTLSLIYLYLHAKFHLKSKKLLVDGRTDARRYRRMQEVNSLFVGK